MLNVMLLIIIIYYVITVPIIILCWRDVYTPRLEYTVYDYMQSASNVEAL